MKKYTEPHPFCHVMWCHVMHCAAILPCDACATILPCDACALCSHPAMWCMCILQLSCHVVHVHCAAILPCGACALCRHPAMWCMCNHSGMWCMCNHPLCVACATILPCGACALCSHPAMLCMCIVQPSCHVMHVQPFWHVMHVQPSSVCCMCNHSAMWCNHSAMWCMHVQPFCHVMHVQPFCHVKHVQPFCHVMYVQPFCHVMHVLLSHVCCVCTYVWTLTCMDSRTQLTMPLPPLRCILLYVLYYNLNYKLCVFVRDEVEGLGHKAQVAASPVRILFRAIRYLLSPLPSLDFP